MVASTLVRRASPYVRGHLVVNSLFLLLLSLLENIPKPVYELAVFHGLLKLPFFAMLNLLICLDLANGRSLLGFLHDMENQVFEK